MEDAILRFDARHPAWDRDMFISAGEDGAALDYLVGAGLAAEDGGVYTITASGRERFAELAAECWLDERPAQKASNPALACRQVRVSMLLDRAFLGRWGHKEACPGLRLPYWPALSDEQVFRVDGERIEWLYMENPLVRALAARGGVAESVACGESFMENTGGHGGYINLDLLMLHSYDFECYMSSPAIPSDSLGWANKDRLLCRFLSADEPLDAIARHFGALHIFMMQQRRLFLGEAFDRDAHQQDAITWWLGLCDTDTEAVCAAERLAPIGRELVGPSAPMDGWVLGIDSLECVQVQEESFWDLFCNIAHPIYRTV